MTHELKTWPEFFRAVQSGAKPFEVRKDDRPYAVGDVLQLLEFEPCQQCRGAGSIERVKRTPFGIFTEDVKCACMATEFPKGRYTGESTARVVSYILTGGEFGIQDATVVMGLKEHAT